MSHRIEPIQQTHGTHGLSDYAPEPIDYALDGAGDTQPDQLSVPEPRPVDGPELLDSLPHAPVAQPETLDGFAHESVAQPAPLDSATHMPVAQPAPIDSLAQESVAQPAPIDQLVDHQAFTQPLAPLDYPSHEHYAGVSPAPLDYPPQAPVEQPAFGVQVAEPAPFYDDTRRVHHEQLFHSTYWML